MGDFHNIFKRLRLASNITQVELAAKLGISRSTIGMYETGAREPDFVTLEKIADFYNVDTDYLLGRTEKTTLVPETIGNNRLKNGSYSLCEKEDSLISTFRKLNELGQSEATKRVEELTCIPRYTESSIVPLPAGTDRSYLKPVAAHMDPDATQEDIDFDNDLMEKLSKKK